MVDVTPRVAEELSKYEDWEDALMDLLADEGYEYATEVIAYVFQIDIEKVEGEAGSVLSTWAEVYAEDRAEHLALSYGA